MIKPRWLIRILTLLASQTAIADPLPPRPQPREAPAHESPQHGEATDWMVVDEYRSKATLLESIPGSKVPKNILEPYMPGVDVLVDMNALFGAARKKTEAQGNGERVPAGAKRVVIVSPARLFIALPVPDAAYWPADPVEAAKSVLGTDQPLDVTVVSYTSLEALFENHTITPESANRAIPFIGIMIAWAIAGHRVVIFEGHPSAFEAGVRNSHVLLVDSAMTPFLQKDWVSTAFGAMRQGARILVHDRKTYTLREVRRF